MKLIRMFVMVRVRWERDFVVSIKDCTPELHNIFLNNLHAVAMSNEMVPSREGCTVTTEISFTRVDSIEESEDNLYIYFQDGSSVAIPADCVECYTLNMGTVMPAFPRKNK